MKKITRWLKLLQARWRLLFGFCPSCNSDAPAIDSCKLCGNYRDWPPSKPRKRMWLMLYRRSLKG